MDFDLACESSSSSDSSSGSSLESAGGLFRGMMAPDVISNVSSSVVVAQSRSILVNGSDRGPTFKGSLSTQSPSRDLSDNLAFPIHEEHGHTGVG